jgi:ABC-type multidrug transport system fused ATPase/permease subunit
MREFVDYLEVDVPFIIAILISFVGAFVLLVLFDFVIGAYCLLMLIPSFLLNRMHSRTTRRLNRGLNDDLEREITVIETRDSLRIDEHFGRVSRWYIRLSHADVRAWLLIQPFFIGLIVLALARSVSLNMEPGDIFAVVAYALRFTDSLDQAPLIVQQYSRLQDITERINSGGVTAE